MPVPALRDEIIVVVLLAINQCTASKYFRPLPYLFYTSKKYHRCPFTHTNIFLLSARADNFVNTRQSSVNSKRFSVADEGRPLSWSTMDTKERRLEVAK